MPTAVYQDEYHIKVRDRARELYNEKYKLKRKILYLCKKLELNKQELSKGFDDDTTFFLHLKKIEYENVQVSVI
jgi:hypothetical protein